MTLKYNIKDLTLINQKTLINLVAERTDYLVYEVEDVLNGLREVIIDAVREGVPVKIENLFTIKQKVSPARTLPHPVTKEPQQIPATLSISVKSSPHLLRVLNGGDTEEENDSD